MKPLSTGDIAPDFSLQDQFGNTHTLSQELENGHVLLLFYPYDQSPNCTKMLCRANEEANMLSRNGISLLGVNNADAESHIKFTEKNFLKMPLLSDRNYKVAEKYNALYSIGPIKVIRRTVVGIDKTGIIRVYIRGQYRQQEIVEQFMTSIDEAEKSIKRQV